MKQQTDVFKQQKLDADQQFKVFACGMVCVEHHYKMLKVDVFNTV